MKLFEMKQIREAIIHSKYGGQALHVHTLNVGHRLFRRYPVIGHLFDMDKKRLQRTAVRLGVRVIKVEYEGEEKQHIDLCGKPFERARREAIEQYLQPTIDGLGELPEVVEQSEKESPAMGG